MRAFSILSLSTTDFKFIKKIIKSGRSEKFIFPLSYGNKLFNLVGVYTFLTGRKRPKSDVRQIDTERSLNQEAV